MIAARQYQTTGTITSGSNVLTLSAPSSTLFVGDMIAVSGAGALNDGVRLALVARVTNIVGATVTLDATATVTSTGAVVRHSASNVTVTGAGVINASFGGNPSNSSDPIVFATAFGCRVTGSLTIRNASNAGVRLVHGARGCVINGPAFQDIGYELGGSYLGAAVWVFGGSSSNQVRNISVSGSSYGIIVDDRTVTASEFDGSSNSNTIEDVTVATSQGGVIVDGSSSNLIQRVTVNGGAFGVSVANSFQGAAPDRRSAVDNVVRDSSASNAATGVRIEGVNTTVTNITYVNCTTNLDDRE
jgi:hypothetical protein